MNRRATLLIGTLLGAFFSLAAFAQESGVYLGGSLGQSRITQWCDTSSDPLVISTACDDKDLAWKLFAGYQFNRYVAVEASYIDWGKVTATATRLGVVNEVAQSQHGYGIAAVGSLPLGPQFSVFAKLGLLEVKQETTRITPNPLTLDRDETEVQYGFGAKYRLSPNFGIRGEWEFTDKRKSDKSTIRAQLLSIGAEYRF